MEKEDAKEMAKGILWLWLPIRLDKCAVFALNLLFLCLAVAAGILRRGEGR